MNADPPAFDPVQEASEESFPASDPPARTVVTGVGLPARHALDPTPAAVAPAPHHPETRS